MNLMDNPVGWLGNSDAATILSRILTEGEIMIEFPDPVPPDSLVFPEPPALTLIGRGEPGDNFVDDDYTYRIPDETMAYVKSSRDWHCDRYHQYVGDARMLADLDPLRKQLELTADTHKGAAIALHQIKNMIEQINNPEGSA